jgi:hypothetical protein
MSEKKKSKEVKPTISSSEEKKGLSFEDLANHLKDFNLDHLSADDFNYESKFDVEAVLEEILKLDHKSLAIIVAVALKIGRVTVKKLEGYSKVFAAKIVYEGNAMTLKSWYESFKFKPNIKASQVASVVAAQCFDSIIASRFFKTAFPDGYIKTDFASIFPLSSEEFKQHMMYRMMRKIRFPLYIAPDVNVSLQQVNLARKIARKTEIMVTIDELSHYWKANAGDYAEIDIFLLMAQDVTRKRYDDISVPDSVNKEQQTKAKVMSDMIKVAISSKPPSLV